MSGVGHELYCEISVLEMFGQHLLIDVNQGAEPGDVLLVDIQDVQPLQDEPWGFTGVFAQENGGGFLTDFYPKA